MEEPALQLDDLQVCLFMFQVTFLLSRERLNKINDSLYIRNTNATLYNNREIWVFWWIIFTEIEYKYLTESNIESNIILK